MFLEVSSMVVTWWIVVTFDEVLPLSLIPVKFCHFKPPSKICFILI